MSNYGGDTEDWLEELIELGQNVRALEDKPFLPDYLVYYLNAFLTIHKSRQYSIVGPMPISFGEIAAYVNLFSIVEVDEFVYLIKEMDDAYLGAQKPETTESDEESN